MSANDHQVGGNHYRKVPGEQHWDRLIRLYGIDVAFVYFVGNITSYVERYREKNGLEDLRKARHYLDKLIEEEEKNLQLQCPDCGNNFPPTEFVDANREYNLCSTCREGT